MQSTAEQVLYNPLLGLRIGGAVIGKSTSSFSLDLAVAVSLIGAISKVFPKSDMPPMLLVTVDTDVKVMRREIRWLLKGFPTGNSQVTLVYVADARKSSDDSGQLARRSDQRVHVNDGLRCHTRHGSTADMLDGHNQVAEGSSNA